MFGRKKPAGSASAEEAQKKKEEQVREEAQDLSKKIERSNKAVKQYQNFILRLAVFLVVVWVLFFQVVGFMRMPSGDMYPRINAGDTLLFYRLDKNVQPQDIICISKTTPEEPKKKTNFVCRVIAVGGDKVDINTESGAVSVNGNVLIESNIFYPTPQYEGYTKFPLTVPEGQCFVLSDKRTDGADSRYFGTVSKKEILGTVITVLRRNNL